MTKLFTLSLLYFREVSKTSDRWSVRSGAATFIANVYSVYSLFFFFVVFQVCHTRHTIEECSVSFFRFVDYCVPLLVCHFKLVTFMEIIKVKTQHIATFNTGRYVICDIDILFLGERFESTIFANSLPDYLAHHEKYGTNYYCCQIESHVSAIEWHIYIRP